MKFVCFHCLCRLLERKCISQFKMYDIVQVSKIIKTICCRGHAAIIVNVASKCGLTATNYKELAELHDNYADSKGLRILAFPCNQFNSQVRPTEIPVAYRSRYIHGNRIDELHSRY